MDGVHDMGGMHGFGPVVIPDGDVAYHEPWEARVFAIHILIGHQRLGAGPGGRAVREEMEPAEYLAASYYERWLFSAQRLLERAGTIRPAEIEQTIERLGAGASIPLHRDPAMAQSVVADLRVTRPMEPPPPDARFAPGEQVRVKRMHPVGHTRCPRYARGVCGVVREVRGADRLPDRATYGERVPREPVYSVEFHSSDLWGAGEEPPWKVSLDLWDSYLEAV